MAWQGVFGQGAKRLQTGHWVLNQGMKPTLYDVAARAGVSIATASRALNGLVVSPANGQRVREAALVLGYVANEAARALRSERTHTMGLIFFDLNNMLGIELIDAIGAEVEAGGYSLLIASARGDEQRYDLLARRFLERRVDGLFCIDARGQGAALAGYAAAKAPVITLFAAAQPYRDIPRIRPSFDEPAAALAGHLSGLGHRHVALVDGDSPPFAAIEDALAGSGVAVHRVAPGEADGMRQVLAAILAISPRPTAVVAREAHARGLLAAVGGAELSVPRDLSVVAVTQVSVDRRRRRWCSRPSPSTPAAWGAPPAPQCCAG